MHSHQNPIQFACILSPLLCQWLPVLAVSHTIYKILPSAMTLIILGITFNSITIVIIFLYLWKQNNSVTHCFWHWPITVITHNNELSSFGSGWCLFKQHIMCYNLYNLWLAVFLLPTCTIRKLQEKQFAILVSAMYLRQREKSYLMQIYIYLTLNFRYLDSQWKK